MAEGLEYAHERGIIHRDLNCPQALRRASGCSQTRLGEIRIERGLGPRVAA